MSNDKWFLVYKCVWFIYPLLVLSSFLRYIVARFKNSVLDLEIGIETLS